MYGDQRKTELWLNKNVNGFKGAIQTHYGLILIWKIEGKQVGTKIRTEIDGKRGKDGWRGKSDDNGRRRNGWEWLKTHGKGSGTGGNVAGRPENDGESPRKYGTWQWNDSLARANFLYLFTSQHSKFVEAVKEYSVFLWRVTGRSLTISPVPNPSSPMPLQSTQGCRASSAYFWRQLRGRWLGLFGCLDAATVRVNDGVKCSRSQLTHRDCTGYFFISFTTAVFS